MKRNFTLITMLILGMLSTQAFGAATIGPAFGKWSSAGMSVDAGKQGTNTMQVIGATFSKPGGKPTMTIPTAASEIAAAAEATPADSATFGFLDSVFKKLTWANLKAVVRGGIVHDTDYSTLASADSAAFAAGRQLKVFSVWTTVPTTLTAYIKVLPGGQLNGSGTVAINGAFEGCDGCFGASQAVTGLKEARPEWWLINAIPGTTDMTTAIQSALSSGASTVIFAKTSYLVTSHITVPAGITLKGAGGGRFSTNVTTITNPTVGSGVFWMVDGTGAPGQVDGPTITGFKLIADYPIKLNDETATIVDGGTATSPYIMKPKLDDIYCQERTSGVGIGISFSKVFDHQVTRCYTSGFSIGMLFQACDIGRVYTNRVTDFKDYGILEIGVLTFGSQSIIENNDILAGKSTATYIKSCARHPRIIDNYLELPSGSAVGAIDMTNIDCPQYGANVPAVPYSIVAERNRIDGQSLFSTFVYRLDGTKPSRSIKLHDVGTTGPIPSPSKLLLINGGTLPMQFTASWLASYDIFLSGGGSDDQNFYNSFITALPAVVTSNGITITPKTWASQTLLRSNNASYQTAYNGNESILLKSTMTESLYAINPALDAGATYSVFITAKSVDSETLRVASLKDNPLVGGGLVDYVLSPEYQTIKVGTFTVPASPQTQGLHIKRLTNTGDINIKSIQWIKTSPAIADTSGATLTALEATVNALKAALRSRGMLAP